MNMGFCVCSASSHVRRFRSYSFRWVEDSVVTYVHAFRQRNGVKGTVVPVTICAI